LQILITNAFERAVKKLHKNEIVILEKNIDKIIVKPNIGKIKICDLVGIMIYKFHMLHQLILLAYTYDEAQAEITLLCFGSHENFYRDLKNQLKN